MKEDFPKDEGGGGGMSPIKLIFAFSHVLGYRYM